MTVKHSGSMDGNENPEPQDTISNGLFLLSMTTKLLTSISKFQKNLRTLYDHVILNLLCKVQINFKLYLI